jgi:hypothetical protein
MAAPPGDTPPPASAASPSAPPASPVGGGASHIGALSRYSSRLWLVANSDTQASPPVCRHLKRIRRVPPAMIRTSSTSSIVSFSSIPQISPEVSAVERARVLFTTE